MDLSVITVTWNSKEHIAEQIKSVRSGCQNISYEHFVVDNGSADGTQEIIAANFPEVRLTRNSANAGFAAANNQAAKNATGEFLLFLNPDMRVCPGSLDKIVAWMRGRPDVGIAGCKLTDENGAPDKNAGPRRFPTLSDQLMIFLKIPHFYPGVLNKYIYQNFNFELEQEVDSVRGAFMLMRRSLYDKLGRAFDPGYFLWFEDVDACRECKKSGLKVVYTPVISCVDFVGQSFKKMPLLRKQKRFFTSMLKYFSKWGWR